MFQLKSLLKLIAEVVAASTFVLLDMAFYEVLDVISKHAKVDYFQTGHHNLDINVKGTGMIANMLRSVVDRFNFRKNITVNLSNESEYTYQQPIPYYCNNNSK